MCAPIPDLGPEGQLIMSAYLMEYAKATPDPLLLEELLGKVRLAHLRQQSRTNIIAAAPRRQMDPALAAILRPVSPHLKGIAQ
ncbi:MAG TPA: hypothetical protein VK150_09775 [Geothrix sp.]|nr:hypothetical protein [Geothrix sp.]